MPSGQAKEDATRLGIVERSTLPRKVRQTQEPIGTRRHVGGIMRHNRICIGATVALGLYGVAIQLLAQPRCECARRIGPRADPISSGNDKRPWPQAGIIDHMISQVDEIRRTPQLNHHIAGTEYTRRNSLGTRVARSH